MRISTYATSFDIKSHNWFVGLRVQHRTPSNRPSQVALVIPKRFALTGHGAPQLYGAANDPYRHQRHSLTPYPLRHLPLPLHLPLHLHLIPILILKPLLIAFLILILILILTLILILILILILHPSREPRGQPRTDQGACPGWTLPRRPPCD